MAGVARKTAKRAYFEGWPKPEWAVTPIIEYVEEDQKAARVKLALDDAHTARKGARHRAEKELARLDAIEEHAREAQVVRAALSNTMSGFAVLGVLSKACVPIAEAARDQVIREARAGNLSWKECFTILLKIANLGEKATRQLREAQAAIRLHLGKPERLIGVTDEKPTQSHELDALAAIADLGEEEVKQACLDLAQDRISPAVERLIEWQVSNQEAGKEVH